MSPNVTEDTGNNFTQLSDKLHIHLSYQSTDQKLNTAINPVL
jgi:hypothetical protein